MSPRALHTDRTVGILMVLAGFGLFLVSLDVITLEILAGSAWLALGIAGVILIGRGWKDSSSILLFVGGFLFTAGVHTALWSFGVLELRPEELLPAIFLWIGLAMVFVWLPAPYKIDLLVPAVLFGGCGVGYYLWWWDVMRMSDLKELYGNGWPVLVILLGAGILLRSMQRLR